MFGGVDVGGSLGLSPTEAVCPCPTELADLEANCVLAKNLLSPLWQGWLAF